jgi:hypothetical protein
MVPYYRIPLWTSLVTAAWLGSTIPPGLISVIADPEAVPDLLIVPVIGLGLAAVPLAFASLYAFFRDAVDPPVDGWVLQWWGYVLLSFVITPLFVSPIYTIQRYRHAGRPRLSLRGSGLSAR